MYIYKNLQISAQALKSVAARIVLFLTRWYSPKRLANGLGGRQFQAYTTCMYKSSSTAKSKVYNFPGRSLLHLQSNLDDVNACFCRKNHLFFYLYKKENPIFKRSRDIHMYYKKKLAEN